jgi:hypothetical protein
MTRKQRSWIPEWARLPNLDELERLSRPDVAQQQLELFSAERPDDSRAGRLARMFGTPGVGMERSR